MVCNMLLLIGLHNYNNNFDNIPKNNKKLQNESLNQFLS